MSSLLSSTSSKKRKMKGVNVVDKPGKREASLDSAKKLRLARAPGDAVPDSASASASASAGRRWARSAPPIRKMIIQPFKVKPEPPETFVKSSFDKLERAVLSIQSDSAMPESREELYRCVQNLCLHSKASELYGLLERCCESNISRRIEALAASGGDGVSFLQLVQGLWQSHRTQMQVLEGIFLYLDRTYVMRTSSIRSVSDMSLHLFRKHLALSPDVQTRLLQGILALIEAERKGEEIDRSLLTNLLSMLSHLNAYKEVFEGKFLSATKTFYIAESARLLEKLSVPDYLRHVASRLDQEASRSRQCFNEGTMKPLISTVELELIKSRTSDITSKGFEELMNNDSIEDLKRMFDLFARVDVLPDLQKAFAEYIKHAGDLIVRESGEDSLMVERILMLKRKLDAILSSSFGCSPTFAHTLKEAFESFIKERENKPAELLAKYIDQLLRPNKRSMAEVDLEKLLNECMIIFRYIHGKDVFEAFYKTDLAKRLLMNLSASDAAEKSMIMKLRSECGARFTKNIEIMFKDMELSADIMNEFKQGNPDGSLEFSACVLTTSAWPLTPPLKATLPPSVEECQEAFSRFYVARHNGRKLTWQPAHSHCVLRANFAHGRRELAVSAFQAVVLLAFNDGAILQFDELLKCSGLEEAVLQSVLVSLVKSRLLKKRSGSHGASDAFRVNAEFQSKRFHIQVSQQMHETVEEQKSTNSRIFAGRTHQIDAAIVRIMKARKRLQHAVLVAECIGQLKFPVQIGDIKKRISSLIDREYLERDKEQSNVYIYLA